MLKKRLIFALLWASGDFCLSRNFRLQKIGDLSWLMEQYRFGETANSIDELMVLDVTRGPRLSGEFFDTLSTLAASIHVPISAGGGLRDAAGAQDLLNAGADKVVCNSALVEVTNCVDGIRDRFGQQVIVSSIDVMRSAHGFEVMLHNGTVASGSLESFLEEQVASVAGEILLNSIDRDGTGEGLDLNLVSALPAQLEQPVVLMGGTGKPEHIIEGLSHPLVDAVATSNLLNFIGDGLCVAREKCVNAGIAIPRWLPAVDVLGSRNMRW